MSWNWNDATSGVATSSCTQQSTTPAHSGVVTATCTDVAGNTATEHYTVQDETQAPVANPTYIAGVPNVAGWSRGPVVVNWNWRDDSGINPNLCPLSSATGPSDQGALTLTASCADVIGNVGTASLPVKVDFAKPVAAPTQAQDAHGTTVSWNWTDATSGVDSSSCTQQSTTLVHVGTVTATCTDIAGNTATGTYAVHDATAPVAAPVLTPTPNGLGWNRTTATVSWNWSDSVSGVDSASCTQSTSQTGTGQLTLTSSCIDKAGNTATDSKTVTVAAVKKADLRVSMSGPTSGLKGIGYTYSITVRNIGPDAAGNVVTDLTLPSKATLVSGGSSWTRSSLASGASVTYTVKIKFTANGSWSVSAKTGSRAAGATAATPDPVSGNNSVALGTRIS